MYGFYRIATSVPKVQIANSGFNIEEIISIFEQENKNESSIILFLLKS